MRARSYVRCLRPASPDPSWLRPPLGWPCGRRPHSRPEGVTSGVCCLRVLVRVRVRAHVGAWWWYGYLRARSYVRCIRPAGPDPSWLRPPLCFALVLLYRLTHAQYPGLCSTPHLRLQYLTHACVAACCSHGSSSARGRGGSRAARGACGRGAARGAQQFMGGMKVPPLGWLLSRLVDFK